MLASLAGCNLELTPLDFRLLAALAGPAGLVCSRDQLLDRLLDDSRALQDRAVDSHTENLRRKLERVCLDISPILAFYGAGYRLDDVQVRWAAEHDHPTR